MIYNPRSMKAEEFICHEEVLDTLDYAEQNKTNMTLIDSIIEKAKLRKGLSHREASVLMACEMPEKLRVVYDLAEQIKKDFYGNRIVMFAPLYLSNYCVNGCVYCPYHLKNKHIARKKLTQEDIVREVINKLALMQLVAIRLQTNLVRQNLYRLQYQVSLGIFLLKAIVQIFQGIFQFFRLIFLYCFHQ